MPIHSLRAFMVRLELFVKKAWLITINGEDNSVRQPGQHVTRIARFRIIHTQQQTKRFKMS